MNWFSLDQAVLGTWYRRVLGPISLLWPRGTSLAVVGPNGSGKSALAALWTGRLEALSGHYLPGPDFEPAEESWIGFERQRVLLEWERHIDLSDVSPEPDPGTLVADFVGDPQTLIDFGLEGKGGRGLKHLSTGELRRACLARAWARQRPYLILDEPYEGLDVQGQALLADQLSRWTAAGVDLAFLTRRADDLGPGPWTRFDLAPASAPPTSGFEPPVWGPTSPGEPVIEFASVTAGYPGVEVLSGLDWRVRRGERWWVAGPNGSGKSTLLALVAGDHPQVFSNEVRLFGRRRGPDLTLDQVRRRIVSVSYAGHLGFRNLFGVTGLEVVASGFQGTVGLRDEPTWDQVRSSRDLVAAWGLTEAANRPWEGLSWGTQRLLLLARALVADAEILLLDEPCQGLDAEARHHVLRRVAEWSSDPDHTLVYVTHRDDEIDPAAFQTLRLGGPQGRS